MTSAPIAVTQEQYAERLAWPLARKIQESWHRIEQWYSGWRSKGGVYVAYSGGLDSTVLLHLVRTNPFLKDKDIPGVFVDTGLEFPEIRDQVKRTDNVVWLKPEMGFKAVLEKYGYPVISKRQAQYINEVRHSRGETATKRLRLTGYRGDGTRSPMGMISRKWQYLCTGPFEISDKCCNVMKKKPTMEAEKKYGKPFIGTRAAESDLRQLVYRQLGCNGFDLKRPKSTPLAFWTGQDARDYLSEFEVPYSTIYDPPMSYARTGCMFCMFGAHLEPSPNRFQRMYDTHPKQWAYCMNNLGLREVLAYIGVRAEPSPTQATLPLKESADA